MSIFNRFLGKSLKLDTAEDVKIWTEELKEMKPTEIHLSGNTFGVDALTAISLALGDNLKIVKCSDMFTGRLKSEIPMALESLVKALETQKSLVEVDLSDNAFGPAGAKPLQRLIINNRNIKILRLNNNGLGIEGARLISEALIAAHEKNVAEGIPDQLRVIVVGRNRMESPGACHFAKAFKAYEKSLIHIQMPQNSIRPDGIVELMDAIKSCHNLEFLDLQDNTFTEKGSLAIAKALPSWPNLKNINLGDCLLSAKGGIFGLRLGVHVIKAMTNSNDKLEKIGLFFNEIDQKGAALIPEMLANKKAITSIELNGNAFDAESDLVENIKSALTRLGKPDALDELDEMEEPDEEEEEASEEETAPDGSNVDDLAEQMGGVKIKGN